MRGEMGLILLLFSNVFRFLPPVRLPCLQGKGAKPMPSSASHGILQADGLDFALLSSIACSTRFVPCDHATMRATDRPTIDARYV